ncbi:Uncharacterised protein [uncultured archaeon]|nr:Uncharacterised protein [uncultured archaeon]
MSICRGTYSGLPDGKGKKLVQKEDIVNFLHGLSTSILEGFGEVEKHGSLSFDLSEALEKSRKKLFIIGVSIMLSGVGFFLIFWGIASAVDAMFAMRGFGFVLVGIIAVLTGALAYKK